MGSLTSERTPGARREMSLNQLLIRAGGFGPWGADLNSERKLFDDLFWQTGRSDKKFQRSRQ